MRKYYSGDILFCGVLRRYVSQNTVAITGNLRLNRFILFYVGGGGSYFPYILLNEIQTMFSPLAKRSDKVLPADFCTDHAYYVKIHRSTVLRSNENMAVEGGTVAHYYIWVIRKFIDFMSLFRHIIYATYSSVQLIRTAEEL